MKVTEFKMPEGISESSQKAMIAISGWMTENFEKFAAGQTSKEDFNKEFESRLKELNIDSDSLSKFKETIKLHAEEIEKMRENSIKADPRKDFEKELKSFFEGAKSQKGSPFSYEVKAAAPVFTTNVPPMGLRFEVEPGINRLDGKLPIIYDLFLKGQTNSAVIHWINYKYKDGGAAFIGEGVLKPLMDWKYEAESASYKKIAVRSKHSEEIFNDFEDFMSEVNLILNENLKEERDKQLLFGDGTGYNPVGIVNNSSAYIAIGGLNGSVVMPNLADVIVAMALQVRMVGRGNADVAILNPYDYAMMKLTKSDSGNYLSAELQALLSSIDIVEDEDMEVGKILVCDSRKHKIKNKKGIFMKTVYENDDMTKNLVGFVVEQFLFSYRSEIFDSCFVYDDIATVQASLLKV